MKIACFSAAKFEPGRNLSMRLPTGKLIRDLLPGGLPNAMIEVAVQFRITTGAVQ